MGKLPSNKAFERPRPAAPSCPLNASVRGLASRESSVRVGFARLSVLLMAAIVLGLFPSAPRADNVVVPGILQRDAPLNCTFLATFSSLYLLDNYGDFQAGDTVVAVAGAWDYMSCQGHGDYQHLPENAIYSARNFDCGCGVLFVEGEYHCAFLITERLGWIGLASHSGFASGDTVNVTGDVRVDGCPAIEECAMSSICLDRNTTSACTLSPAAPSSWGMIKALFR